MTSVSTQSPKPACLSLIVLRRAGDGGRRAPVAKQKSAY